jgi:hypothetical protein
MTGTADSTTIPALGRRARSRGDAERAGARSARDRPWLARVLCASLLVAGAGVTGGTASSLLSGTDSSSARAAVGGVLMPDEHRYRDVATELLERRRPVRLQSIAIGGDDGRVTVRRAAPGRPGVLSSYLNPGVMSVLARAAGASSDVPIIVRELRLAPAPGSGRQRWLLRGTRDGRPWGATVNPNGTDLRQLDHPGTGG